MQKRPFSLSNQKHHTGLSDSLPSSSHSKYLPSGPSTHKITNPRFSLGWNAQVTQTFAVTIVAFEILMWVTEVQAIYGDWSIDSKGVAEEYIVHFDQYDMVDKDVELLVLQ